MHPRINTAVRVAIAMMLLRLALFFSGAEFTWQDPAFLFLALAAFPLLAIYAIWPRSVPTGFAHDVKTSLRITAVYGLLITLFLYFYFTLAETDYFANNQEIIVENELKANPELNREMLRERVETFFSVRNFSVLALLSSLVMSVFYSVLFPAVKRLMPGSVRP